MFYEVEMMGVVLLIQFQFMHQFLLNEGSISISQGVVHSFPIPVVPGHSESITPMKYAGSSLSQIFFKANVYTPEHN